MELIDIYKETDFSGHPLWLQDVLKNLTLVDFTRTRNGSEQTFHFTILYKGETHVLHHHFCYHMTGVDDRCKWNRGILAKKPFKKSNQELIALSNALMPCVNEWNRQKEALISTRCAL